MVFVNDDYDVITTITTILSHNGQPRAQYNKLDVSGGGGKGDKDDGDVGDMACGVDCLDEG